MARTERLTALKVARTKTPGMYADGGGLYLQVTEGTTGINKSWIYRFTLAGKTREMGLGPHPLYGLAEARALALDARRLRHQGVDPIEHRRAARAQAQLDAAKAMTFRQCADAYVASHRPSWRNASHVAQWSSTLATYADPIIGALPVQAIDTQLVLKVLQQHVEAKRGQPAGEFCQARPETSSRLRGRIEAVLDWAKVRGYRAGENPARWRGHLDHLLPARSKVRRVEHHAALPYAELPGFLVELRKHEGIAARALEFTILTAARKGEVIGMRWSEIDLAEKVWTVPAQRMKSGREHRCPLSARVFVILQEMQALRPVADADAYVFAIKKKSMLDLLHTLRPGLTVHGFRATFKTWASDRTSFQNEIVEAALAHVTGSKVEQAYQRGDLFEKRRRLMQQWAAFTTETTAHHKVVAMQRRA
jgi:integrase